jgi:hypothetical protein
MNDVNCSSFRFYLTPQHIISRHLTDNVQIFINLNKFIKSKRLTDSFSKFRYYETCDGKITACYDAFNIYCNFCNSTLKHEDDFGDYVKFNDHYKDIYRVNDTCREYFMLTAEISIFYQNLKLLLLSKYDSSSTFVNNDNVLNYDILKHLCRIIIQYAYSHIEYL